MTEGVESFSAMLRSALGVRIVPEADTFVKMIADDCIMEFPYSPPGFPSRLEGNAAVTHHMESLGELIAFDRICKPTVYATTDPNVVIVEFEGFGRGVATGEPYEQLYISVIRTFGGKIVSYKDYWNPLAVLRATRGGAYVDAITAEAPVSQ